MNPHDIRGLAYLAEVSEPTARRFLLGAPVRPSLRARLERACAQLGLVPAASSPTLDVSHAGANLR